jgi:hypothetical protein
MSMPFSPILDTNDTRRIQRDPHSAAHEEYPLLECNGLHSRRISEAFRRNALSPPSESRRKPSM